PFDVFMEASLGSILKLAENPDPFDIPSARPSVLDLASMQKRWADAATLDEKRRAEIAGRHQDGSKQVNRMTLDFIRDGAPEGERPILQPEADRHEVVTWTDSQDRRWAFTDRNAGSYYFQPFRDLAQLDQLSWEHITNNDFRDPLVKEAKQAEFLVYRSFPWT